MKMQVCRPTFNDGQLTTVNHSVALAEELVSNYYKMSASQWLHPKYDITTLADLTETEIIDGPFAQVIRYEGKLKDGLLGSSAYDFYKICIQDHTILETLEKHPEIPLAPFALYVVTHELVHIVRFSRFQQNFNASEEEKFEEERRVHKITHEILDSLKTTGLDRVFDYYQKWRTPMEGLASIS